MATFIYSLLFILLLSFSALAASADFDATFSADGKTVTAMGVGASEIQKVVVQADGKLVAVGYAQNTGSAVRQFAVVRYNADGSLDSGFGNGGRVFTTIAGGNAYSYDVVVQPNGRIVVVGLLDTGSRYSSVIVRYNSNGALDNSFSGDGILVYNYDATSSDYSTSVLLQTDGKILVSSYSIVLIGNSPVYSFFISRFNSGGTFDTTFNNTGKTLGEFGNFTTGFVKIGLQPDGRIIAAGPGGNGSNIDFAAVRYNANGTFDGSFGSAGRVYTNFSGNDVPRALAMLPDGRFVIAGYNGASVDTSFMLVRYTANGVNDTTFGFAGFVSFNVNEFNDVAESVVVQPDGKIVIAGRTGANLANNDMAVVRLRANGAADPTFGTGGVKAFSFGNGDDLGNSIAVQPNGRIIAAGSAEQQTTTPNFAVARLLGKGTVGDFDGDGKSDIGVFRPADGTWYLNQSADGSIEYPFGNAADKPVIGDFDGDGAGDIAVFRPANGRWYVLRSRDGFLSVNFGLAEDVPVPADFDGDGKADIAVFRTSTGTWYYLRSGANNNSFVSQPFGLSGDKPVAGDFDRDGRADFAVFRPSNGVWYIQGSQRGFFAAQFGLSNDIPLAGDFDGDLMNDIAVFRPSDGNWYVLRSTDGNYQVIRFGLAGDVPQAADFDGDGRADFGIYRPSSGTWYVLRSTNNSYEITNWGLNGDTPTASFVNQ